MCKLNVDSRVEPLDILIVADFWSVLIVTLAPVFPDTSSRCIGLSATYNRLYAAPLTAVEKAARVVKCVEFVIPVITSSSDPVTLNVSPT